MRSQPTQPLSPTRDNPPVASLRAAVLQMLRDTLRDLSDPYRPERHYMRGPGPKWRAKHT